MREPDFRPQWYREHIRQERRFRSRCYGLAGLFLVMVAWNAAALRDIRRVEAQLSLGAAQRGQAEHINERFRRAQQVWSTRQEWLDRVVAVDAQVGPTGVLAEILELAATACEVEAVHLVDARGNVEEPQKPVASQADWRGVLRARVADASGLGDLLAVLDRCRHINEHRVLRVLQRGGGPGLEVEVEILGSERPGALQGDSTG